MRSPKKLDDFSNEDVMLMLMYRNMYLEPENRCVPEMITWVNYIAQTYSKEAVNNIGKEYPNPAWLKNKV